MIELDTESISLDQRQLSSDENRGVTVSFGPGRLTIILHWPARANDRAPIITHGGTMTERP